MTAHQYLPVPVAHWPGNLGMGSYRVGPTNLQATASEIRTTNTGRVSVQKNET